MGICCTGTSSTGNRVAVGTKAPAPDAEPAGTTPASFGTRKANPALQRLLPGRDQALVACGTAQVVEEALSRKRSLLSADQTSSIL